MRRTTSRTTIALAFASLLAAVTTAPAQETTDAPPAPPAGDAEIEPFLGEWVLEAITDRGSINSLITFSTEDGAATADFYLDRLADLTIDDIRSKEGGLLMLFNLEFGDQLVPVELELAREGGGLVGDLSTAFFNAEINGMTRNAAEAAGIQVQRRPVGEREDLANARLEIGDQAIRLRFDRLPAPGPDYDRLESLADGEVLQPVYGKPLKFWTDADLTFGESTVAAHNHGPTYPGVYSLWLKRADDGWRLVFNHLADVWGTMHMAEHDAAEVPLEMRSPTEPAERTKGVLEATDGGGLLTIRWGSMEWSTPFQLAE